MKLKSKKLTKTTKTNKQINETNKHKKREKEIPSQPNPFFQKIFHMQFSCFYLKILLSKHKPFNFNEHNEQIFNVSYNSFCLSPLVKVYPAKLFQFVHSGKFIQKVLQGLGLKNISPMKVLYLYLQSCQRNFIKLWCCILFA